MQICEHCGIKVQGTFPRLGLIDGEKFTFPKPADILKDIHHHKLDLFTFLQHPFRPLGALAGFEVEQDNLAILQVSTFDHWFGKQVNKDVRNLVRKCEKAGVKVADSELNTDFVRGVWELNNESKVRMGKRFPHFGTSLEWTRSYIDSFEMRAIFISAYLGTEMIGFLKMVMDEHQDDKPSYACILEILGKLAHRDKNVTRALMAQAVKCCEARGISLLAYDRFQYGSKTDGLQAFKKDLGFERQNVPRYYVPVTRRGRIAYGLGLHRRLQEVLPESVSGPLRNLRHALIGKS